MPAGTLIPNTQQELINRAQLRETYLLWLITDTLQEGAPLLSQLQSLGLLVEGGYYRVYTLKVYPAERSLDHALLMQQLRAMAEQVLQDRKLRGEMCIDHSSVLNIVVNSDRQECDAEAALQEVCASFSRITGLQPVYGSGIVVDSRKRICESRRIALKAMSGQLRADQLLYDGNSESPFGAETTVQELLAAKFRDFDLVGFEEIVHGYLEFLRTCVHAEREREERFLFACVQTVTRESSRMGATAERFESYLPMVSSLMQSDCDGCADALSKLSEQIFKHLNIHRTNEGNHLLSMAKDYVRDHIGDEELSLAKVSDHVGLSRVYFCKLFHQLEGVTFNAYLKKTRIEKAKQLLLTTNLKIFEVSNAVGFSHAKYFGQVFKECVGQTPLEFQRCAQEGDLIVSEEAPVWM